MLVNIFYFFQHVFICVCKADVVSAVLPHSRALGQECSILIRFKPSRAGLFSFKRTIHRECEMCGSFQGMKKTCSKTHRQDAMSPISSSEWTGRRTSPCHSPLGTSADQALHLVGRCGSTWFDLRLLARTFGNTPTYNLHSQCE